jgi:CRISPR/Cas system CSM-associated protein Csm3 (group 7 of RAMP superfamily)
MSGSLEAKVVNYLVDILRKGQVWLGGRKSVGMGNVKLTSIEVLKIGFRDGQIVEEDVTTSYLSRSV